MLSGPELIFFPALGRQAAGILLGMVAGLAAINGAESAELTDKQIREILIQNSILNYPGVCACPYSKMRSGRRCGKKSAYSKPAGYSPLCYERDISDAMVKAYRSRNQ